MNDDALLELLFDLGADKIKHGRKTLLDHLVGTADILRRWTDDENTFKAGLFHSIYGTEFFKDAPMQSLAYSAKDRRRIECAIGPAAERLVFIFCVMDRKSLGEFYRGPRNTYYVRWHEDPDKLPIQVFEDEFASLIQISWANTLEQTPEGSPGWRETVEESKNFLPEKALRELRAYTASVGFLLGTSEPEETKTALKGWPNKNFLVHGPVERLGGFADFSFEDLVKLPRVFARAITPEGKHIHIAHGEEREHYDAGRTIYWHSLKSPTIEMWLEALDRDLGLVPGATRVSAFASRKGAGMPPHYDPNDNFVCQARGKKTWRVSDTRVLYPTVGATIGVKPDRIVLAESGGLPSEMPPFKTVEMLPGDVMFMPRGQWHDTVTEDESLHFNVQCGLANWKDAVDFVLSTSLKMHTPELRAPILKTPEFKQVLQRQLLQAAENIAKGELDFDAEAFRQFVIRRKKA